MDAPKTPHPDDQILHEYGLGKLDDELTSTIDEHLNACHECRERVASATADSFLGRFRDIPKPTAESIPTDSLGDSTLSWIQPKPGSPPRSTNPMPPGLAEHPDYQIKRELGQGGMGVVYLAHNVLMGRDEVLKVLSRRIMERPSVLERFQREIRTVAKLSHPNIVAAYSAFRIEGGLVFAMEYVEGLDLSKLITTKGPLSVAHAADFVRQAALGLQHAHEMGMVHRDIKPANLILTRVGESKVVKVLDFGLAKAHHEQNVEGPLTLKGQALGTPAYIAPEQIMDAPDVDIRADLYSLGATLFHLLAGHPPFECGSIYDLYQAHISRDADSLTLLRPEVPAELSALVAKMMAKAPKQRFQTPAEVAQALTPFCKSKAAKVQAETSQFDPTRSDPFVTVQEPESPEPASTVPDRVFTDQTREEFIDRAVRETPKPHQSTPEPNRPHNKERLIRGVEAAEFGPIESQLRRLGLVGGLAIIAIIGVVLLGLYVTVIANRGDIRREDNGSKVASVSAPSLSEPTADGKREEIRPTATPEPSPLAPFRTRPAWSQ